MTGVRLPDGFGCTTPELEALGYQSMPRGAYWKEVCAWSPERDGTWSICTPNGRIGSIAKHAIIEHDDRTITASPSILVYTVDGARYTADERDRLVASHGEEQVLDWERGRPGYHGYLERGVWRDC